MKRQMIALLIVAALMPWPLLITRDHWWAFILVSIAIVAALRLVLGSQWRDYAGLRLSPVHAVLAIIAFAAVVAGSTILFRYVYEAAALKVTEPAIEDQIGFLFQAFNEEVFFRALMVGLFIQLIPSAPLVSLGTAFFFVVPHFLLYRFSNPMHLALSIGALVTLFLAGVSMNNFYLTFRHIGFSWALHAGWNVIWLPATFNDATTSALLREPQVFNRVLGAPAVVIAACAMTVLSFALLALRRTTEAPNTRELP